MDFEGTTLSAISHTEEDKFIHVWNTKKLIKNRQNK